MPYSESQKRANYKYRDKNIKRIPLDVPNEMYEKIKQAADDNNETVNGYIKTAINQRMEKDQ